MSFRCKKSVPEFIQTVKEDTKITAKRPKQRESDESVYLNYSDSVTDSEGNKSGAGTSFSKTNTGYMKSVNYLQEKLFNNADNQICQEVEYDDGRPVLMYVDVRISENRSERISVREGDTPESLVKTLPFCNAPDFTDSLRDKL